MNITATYADHQIVLKLGMHSIGGELETVAGIGSAEAAELIEQLQACVEQSEADPHWDERPRG